MQPSRWELKSLTFQNSLTFTVNVDLFLPVFHFPFQALNIGDENNCVRGGSSLDGLLFEVTTGFWHLKHNSEFKYRYMFKENCHKIAVQLAKNHYRWMEGRHIGSQHGSKFAQSILMPRIVFHRDFGLNFAIINNDRTKFWKNQIYVFFLRNHHCITRNTTFSQKNFYLFLKLSTSVSGS